MNLRSVRLALSSFGAAARLAWRFKSAGGDWIDQVFRTAADTLPFQPRLSDPYSQHATVYRAVRAMTRNVARVPLEFFRPGTDVVVEDHPIVRVFQRPNPLMRGTQLVESVSADMEMFGNALWLLGPTSTMTRGERVPASIRRLDPRRTKLVLDDNDEPARYEYQVRGLTVRLDPEQVVHFKEWSPLDETWGQSWLEPAMDEVEADYYAQRWDKKFFLRGAEPGVVLIPQPEFSLSDQNAERLLEKWNSKAQGVGRSHGAMVMPRGIDVKVTGIGHRDMDFVNLRRLSRENTLSASGTPPAIAGILEYANYANMTPQLRIFFHLEILPRLKNIEAVIQADLLDRIGIALEVYFKEEALMILVDEIGAKVETAKNLWGMGAPLSELNDRFEMGLDLKGVAGADTPWIPTGVKPADQALEPAPTFVPPKIDQPGEGQDQTPAPADSGPRPVGRASWPNFGEVARAAAWRRLMATTDDLRSKAHVRWRQHVSALEREVMAALAAAQKGVTTRTVNVDVVTFDQVQADQEAILLLEPVWRAAIMRGGDTVGQEIGARVDIDFLDHRVQAALTNRRQDIRGVDARMAADLRDTILEGVNEGESEEKIRRRVLDFFSGERANARTIARTEVHAAFSSGRFAGMEEVGIETHRWLTSRDDRVRDLHEVLELEKRRLGEPFSNGLLYPLDPSGPPEEVINCRCVTIPGQLA